MHDLIIIGAGPAGLTAGLYAGRAGLKTVLLEKMSCGGQILLTETVENYPGFSHAVRSAELMRDMEAQVRNLNVEIIQDEAKNIRQEAGFWDISGGANNYQAKAVIAAVGSVPKLLNVAGEKELTGRGVSYCAVCDGPLYRNKAVAVIGGGDTAVEEALYLARFSRKVFIIHRRGSFRAAEILAKRLKQNNKVGIIWDSVVKRINGINKVEGIIIENVKNKKESGISCDGVFVCVGRSPDTGFLGGLVKKDEHGHILTDEEMRASVFGIFAAGDCRRKALRQVVTACSDGAVAAYSAQKYLEELPQR